MKYNMYQELVDKINELNKENKKYKEMIDSIPLRALRFLMTKGNTTKTKEWSEVYNERLRRG